METVYFASKHRIKIKQIKYNDRIEKKRRGGRKTGGAVEEKNKGGRRGGGGGGWGVVIRFSLKSIRIAELFTC